MMSKKVQLADLRLANFCVFYLYGNQTFFTILIRLSAKFIHFDEILAIPIIYMTLFFVDRANACQNFDNY